MILMVESQNITRDPRSRKTLLRKHLTRGNPVDNNENEDTERGNET